MSTLPRVPGRRGPGTGGRRWTVPSGAGLAALLFLSAPAARASSPQKTAVPAASVPLDGATTPFSRPDAAPNLGLTLSDDLGGGEGLAEDFALEVAPWWLVPHWNLALEDYLRGVPRTALHNLTLSVATSAATAEDPMQASAGLRTALVWGRVAASDDALATCREELSAATLTQALWIADWLKAHPEQDLEAAEEAWQAYLDSTGTPEAAQGRTPAEIQAAADTRQAACQELLETRQGFALDLAAAGSLELPDSNAARATPGTAGVWLSPACLQSNYSVVGLLGIFAGDPSGETSFASSDPELRAGVQWIHTWNRVAVAPETLWSLPPGAADPLAEAEGRLALGLDVRVSDTLWINTAWGVAYPWDRAGSLISQVGLTLDSGTTRQIAPAVVPQLPE